jgi:small subunit ribosomal protein S19e
MLMKDIPQDKVIKETARRLQSMEEMKPPAWSSFVKTGVSRERPPQQKDWWHTRAASILRKLYSGDQAGVSKLTKVYSGRKRRGHKPKHRYKASGAVIRKMLQQLEAAGLLKTVKGKGRLITQKGKAFLREAAEAAGKS